MDYTLAEKIIKSHLLSGSMDRGAELVLGIDQTLAQDLTGILVAQYIGAVDPEELRTERTVFYCDHNAVAASSESAEDHLFLRTTAERYGAVLSKTGNGICHFLHCQRFAVPGKTLVGSDSHTPTSGALGMLAIGSGGLTVAGTSLGEGFRMRCPQVMRVELKGRLRPGGSGKDIALELLRLLTVKGGRGFILEYGGEGVGDLSIPERQTIANMSAETGAIAGIFPSDRRTKAFLRACGREGDYQELSADPEARYDRKLEIDLDKLEPLVALPDMPDQVVRVAEAGRIVPHSVFIGSCTNGSFSDIARAAQVLKGRGVHPHVDLTIGPGSRQVLAQLIGEGVLKDLVDAGARILECSCGPCIGIGQVPPHRGVSVRTTNRNFPGRSGCVDASIYLVSPETAAATAVNGYLSDPRSLIGAGEERVTDPPCYPVDDSGFIYPIELSDRRRIEILQGANISDLPTRGPLRDPMAGGVSLKVRDNITTDDIVPSNPETVKYNANIPKLADFSFAYVDPAFPERARRLGHSMIVAGENYGQGSSRESAALLPMYLGVEVVVAKSYARIHKDNLFNYGILPLVFKDPEDFDRVEVGEEYLVRNVEAGLESLRFLIEFPRSRGVVEATLSASTHEKRLLLLGGALNDLIAKYRGAHNTTA